MFDGTIFLSCGIQVHHGHSSYIPSMTVLFAVAALALGVGVFPRLARTSESTSSSCLRERSLPSTGNNHGCG